MAGFYFFTFHKIDILFLRFFAGIAKSTHVFALITLGSQKSSFLI